MTAFENARIEDLTEEIRRLREAMVGTETEPGHLTKIYGRIEKAEHEIEELGRKTKPCRIAEVASEVHELKRAADERKRAFSRKEAAIWALAASILIALVNNGAQALFMHLAGK